MYEVHARDVDINIAIKVQSSTCLNRKRADLGQGDGQILLLFASNSLLVYAKNFLSVKMSMSLIPL